MPTRATPTDRGYAVIFERDGDVRIAVCGNVVDDTPEAVYAMHYKVRQIKVDQDIEFAQADNMRYTKQPVAVQGASGVVYIRRWPTAKATADLAVPTHP